MGMRNLQKYYEILGARFDATQDEVKQAYRDMIRVWHPDRFPHDPRLQRKAEEKTKEINEAYQVLLSQMHSRADHISQQKQEGDAFHASPAQTVNKPYHPDGAYAKTPEYPLTRDNSLGMKFRLILPGSFVVDKRQPLGHYGGFFRRQARIAVNKPFYLGTAPVTEEQYAALMRKSSPRRGNSSNFVQVKWAQAESFTKRLTEREGICCRLPRPNEWEYAFRGGRAEGRLFYDVSHPWGLLAIENKFEWCEKVAPVRPLERTLLEIWYLGGIGWWIGHPMSLSYSRPGRLEFRCVLELH